MRFYVFVCCFDRRTHSLPLLRAPRHTYFFCGMPITRPSHHPTFLRSHTRSSLLQHPLKNTNKADIKHPPPSSNMRLVLATLALLAAAAAVVPAAAQSCGAAPITGRAHVPCRDHSCCQKEMSALAQLGQTASSSGRRSATSDSTSFEEGSQNSGHVPSRRCGHRPCTVNVKLWLGVFWGGVDGWCGVGADKKTAPSPPRAANHHLTAWAAGACSGGRCRTSPATACSLDGGLK